MKLCRDEYVTRLVYLLVYTQTMILFFSSILVKNSSRFRVFEISFVPQCNHTRVYKSYEMDIVTRIYIYMFIYRSHSIRFTSKRGISITGSIRRVGLRRFFFPNRGMFHICSEDRCSAPCIVASQVSSLVSYLCHAPLFTGF